MLLFSTRDLLIDGAAATTYYRRIMTRLNKTNAPRWITCEYAMLCVWPASS